MSKKKIHYDVALKPLCGSNLVSPELSTNEYLVTCNNCKRTLQITGIKFNKRVYRPKEKPPPVGNVSDIDKVVHIVLTYPNKWFNISGGPVGGNKTAMALRRRGFEVTQLNGKCRVRWPHRKVSVSDVTAYIQPLGES